MRQDYWQLGTWGRIPVSMHWTVLLSFAWLYLIFMNLAATLIGSVALFLVFVAHELGHVVMLRRRKIVVTGIALFGIHGETSYNDYAAKAGDAVAIAWGGVAAQALILVLAIAATALVPFAQVPYGAVIWGPMSLVFININIFLMIIALLPIGPFDGHIAWQVIPRTRAKLRRRKPPPAARKPEPEPETRLTAEERRELDERAKREAAQLMTRLSRKSDSSTEDH